MFDRTRMSFGFSVGDIVAIGSLAWNIYRKMAAAPAQLQQVKDSVGLLHFTLNATAENVRKATDLYDSTVSLYSPQVISKQCETALLELQRLLSKYNKPKLNLIDRWKWGMEDVQDVQNKLQAALQGIISFNTTVALSLSLNFSTTQQDIISTVNRIQAEVQAGKREGSVISKTAAQSTIEDSESLLDGVLKELEEEGVSSKDIAENRSFIVQWILKGIQGGAWEEQPEPLPLYSLHKQTAVYHHTQRHGCKIEILSAAWGGTIVTERLRQFFMTHTRPSTKMRAFVPSNTFMGIDPLSGKRKLFIMVWRRRWFSEGNALSRYSAPQVVRCFEDQEVMLDYDANLPPSELVPLSQNGVVVLDATYGNKGVTASVSRLIRDGFRVENSLLGGDPLSGVRKSMVLTYSYGPPDDYLDCYIRVVREEEELWIPPRLTIHAACWSTADITEGLRAQVDQAHQTLSLVTGHALSCSDPWFGIMKTYAILYQYGEDPSQLIVANDRSGVIEINPRSPVRRGFFNPIPPNHRDPHVVAAVWGMQHISLQQFGLIPQMAEIPCTNEWFGFDGWENHNKTFLVFVQDPRTEVIKCFAQREGQELVLPFNQPQHLDLYRRSTMEAVLDSGDSSPDLSPSTDYG